MEKVEKVTFHIISHTHWDREWYLPFEVFRIELVELIDNLLDILEQNDGFIFHLDGQSIILQDYLEIKPHKRDQIKKFVKSGNLLVGPWYILSDQFLTSGESTIRNLLYGLRSAKEFGSVMLVGYLVDQFGQIAQLPQIFNGFNIHSAIVGRGIQDSIAEHTWYGLNGDKLLAIALTHWYNNAQRLPSEKDKLYEYLNRIYETQAKTSYSGHILLMNGCDHLFPQNGLPKVLKSLNNNQKWQLVQNSLENALQNISKSHQVNSYPIYYGELRDDNNKYILAGTLSSRVYLKLTNYSCQTKLEKIIEPLSVLLSLNKKVVYPYEQIKYAWKLLIQNHAHDSICGCSIDDVHKEMGVRFAKVNQVLDKLHENLLSSLKNVETFQSNFPTNKQYIQLINLTNYRRNDIIEAELEFPLGPPAEHPSATPTINKEAIKNIVLKHKDTNIKFEVLDNHKTSKMVRSKEEVPLLQAIQKIKILFPASIEPFSVCSYEIEIENRSQPPKASLAYSEKSEVRQTLVASHLLEFENQSYKLTINENGTISILLKKNNFNFNDTHYFTIEDDLGDEYNFVPNNESNIISSKDWKWGIKTIEENYFRKRIMLTTNEIQDIKLEYEITCYKDSDRIDFKTRIKNQLKNKRLRLHFPTNLDTNYLNADTPFGTLQRARPSQDWVNYAYSQPLNNWIDHSNGNAGLAFFSKGLADYELYRDGCGFAITLIRGIGKLSNVKSHSLIQTPDAQCNREIEFSYALYPHIGDCYKAFIHKQQLIYQSPIITNQSNTLFNLSKLITVSNELLISSLKRSEDSETLYILRLFNPYNNTLNNCCLNLNFLIKKLLLLNLNEETQTILGNSISQVNFEMRPYQIITFGFEV